MPSVLIAAIVGVTVDVAFIVVIAAARRPTLASVSGTGELCVRVYV